MSQRPFSYTVNVNLNSIKLHNRTARQRRPEFKFTRKLPNLNFAYFHWAQMENV